MVKQVKSEHTAADKVVVLGFSNGGMMASRLYCELPSAFDAFVLFGQAWCVSVVCLGARGTGFESPISDLPPPPPRIPRFDPVAGYYDYSTQTFPDPTGAVGCKANAPASGFTTAAAKPIYHIMVRMSARLLSAQSQHLRRDDLEQAEHASNPLNSDATHRSSTTAKGTSDTYYGASAMAGMEGKDKWEKFSKYMLDSTGSPATTTVNFTMTAGTTTCYSFAGSPVLNIFCAVQGMTHVVSTPGRVVAAAVGFRWGGHLCLLQHCTSSHLVSSRRIPYPLQSLHPTPRSSLLRQTPSQHPRSTPGPRLAARAKDHHNRSSTWLLPSPVWWCSCWLSSFSAGSSSFSTACRGMRY